MPLAFLRTHHNSEEQIKGKHNKRAKHAGTERAWLANLNSERGQLASVSFACDRTTASQQ